MIPLFSRKHIKEDMLAFFLLEKNEIMLNNSRKKERNDFVSFKRQIFISSINNY